MAIEGPIDLSAIEEAILIWQQASVPWNGHMDVTADHIDATQLRRAYNAALAHHPLTSSSIQQNERGRYQWVRHDDLDIGDIPVVECSDDAALVRLRVELLNTPLRTDRAPMIRPVIARCPSHDVLVSCLSHVMCDGLSSIRFLHSVGRAYRDVDDPPPAVDIRTAHRVVSGEPPTSWSTVTERWRQGVDMAAAGLTERSRLASRGGAAPGHFGLIFKSIDAEPVSVARRRHGASFDEYTMAALHLTVERWNRSSGAPCERVGVTQTVNMRPAAWRDDVVVNLAAFSSILTHPADRTDLAAAIAAVRPQLDTDRLAEHARGVANAARLARLIPASIRRRAVASASASQFDTCVLTNLGRITDPPRLSGEDEPVLCGATPAMPEVGFAIGLHSSAHKIHFDVSYRTERFNEAGAADFIDAYATMLTTG